MTALQINNYTDTRNSCLVAQITLHPQVLIRTSAAIFDLKPHSAKG